MTITGNQYGTEIRSPSLVGWFGRKDGKVLIGKVYGHLSDQHAQRQAGRRVLS